VRRYNSPCQPQLVQEGGNLMVLVKTPYGDFLEPPYTDEENWEFEQRLRRGGDITIVHGSKRNTGGGKAKRVGKK
jgi:hypothetical protein